MLKLQICGTFNAGADISVSDLYAVIDLHIVHLLIRHEADCFSVTGLPLPPHCQI